MPLFGNNKKTPEERFNETLAKQKEMVNLQSTNRNSVFNTNNPMANKPAAVKNQQNYSDIIGEQIAKIQNINVMVDTIRENIKKLLETNNTITQTLKNNNDKEIQTNKTIQELTDKLAQKETESKKELEKKVSEMAQLNSKLTQNDEEYKKKEAEIDKLKGEISKLTTEVQATTKEKNLGIDAAKKELEKYQKVSNAEIEALTKEQKEVSNKLAAALNTLQNNVITLKQESSVSKGGTIMPRGIRDLNEGNPYKTAKKQLGNLMSYIPGMPQRKTQKKHRKDHNRKPRKH
jgi:DNA repair exonuclease SbcCD ATPase subunit